MALIINSLMPFRQGRIYRLFICFIIILISNGIKYLAIKQRHELKTVILSFFRMNFNPFVFVKVRSKVSSDFLLPTSPFSLGY
jgi:hypothetical protein